MWVNRKWGFVLRTGGLHKRVTDRQENVVWWCLQLVLRPLENQWLPRMIHSKTLFNLFKDAPICSLLTCTTSFFLCLCLYLNMHLTVVDVFLLHACVCICASVRVCMYVRLCLHVYPQGTVCEDWTAVCCCYPLAVCQMIRETKRRMKTQTYQVSTALECSWKKLET